MLALLHQSVLRVLRGPYPRHCAWATQLKNMSQRWQACGNNVSDLTGARFESQISRRDSTDQWSSG